ncbi:MAG: nicotinate (nicotinamide) nucleotide adenylyltransferase [Treponema sp.]|uniref:nicotinate (nicotinamide) nucleotide adenylyltransferase n=1 Tax=Treponema sp. TaxID=166 RepID=UPI0025D9678F|nr:nicotinate (nicotinamide) nucleotide adenylyltransferase [Treponema sp.]MBQ9282600.1 nicotinate (nicotinamide) nucleotide adenylyltransferase [Treponema sp.]
MKIAMLGGSFNPIHIGHLILADSVCRSLGYEKILFVPTACPPHKAMSEEVEGTDRLAMVSRAVADDERFVAEACEIERGGISYTWDTICFLEQKYKNELDGKIGLVMGEDLLADYDKWDHAAELASKVDLILACRPKNTGLKAAYKNAPVGAYGKNPMKGVTRENFPFPHKKVENPKVEISSSEIRQKIAEDGAWRYLVSKDVFEYIKSRNLYAK